jgi:hypothetical protein
MVSLKSSIFSNPKTEKFLAIASLIATTTVSALLPMCAEAKTLEELLIEKGVISKTEAATTVGGAYQGSDAAKVYYNDGTRIEFPDNGFTTKMKTLLQVRYTNASEYNEAPRRASDPIATYNGINNTRTNTSTFDVRRARLEVSGSALYEEFLYEIQADFVGTANDTLALTDRVDDRAEANLKDAYIIWQPCEGYQTQAGQFRPKISRQWNTHDAMLQFPDRTVVSSAMDLGRQYGAAQHAELMDGKLNASVGLFNGESTGEGISRTGIDTNHTIVGSLRFNPTGKMDVYEEGDVNNTEELATSVGTTYAYSESHQAGLGTIARMQDVGRQVVSADANLKYQGLSVHGEYFFDTAETQHSNSLDYTRNGFYVQSGYFIDPSTLELAGRYGYLDCDNGQAPGVCSGVDTINEASATINYYWWKHSMKAQLAYEFVNEDVISSNPSNDYNTNRWMLQISSYF